MCGEKRMSVSASTSRLGSPPHVRGKELWSKEQVEAAGITPACAGKSEVVPETVAGQGDHPRMCGEKFSGASTQLRCWGSPPHVRGKVRAVISHFSLFGITPACAGKSRHPRSVTFALWDHPRMCGEKFSLCLWMAKTWGSPPHVRGKVHRIKSILSSHWDHPRMCGEKGRVSAPLVFMTGSPPHVRGKGFFRRFRQHCDGITPACAGKSFCTLARSDRYQDHPRMCGEKLVHRTLQSPLPGSPPHVRGKVDDLAERLKTPRITPACAGKSIYPFLYKFRTWDHPRMCGEKLSAVSEFFLAAGSPPHVRGKDFVHIHILRYPGITPACAGKRDTDQVKSVQQQDHPRMCGEKFLRDGVLPLKRGSPPHVRGKVSSSFADLLDFRITPACAGKSRLAGRFPPKMRDHPRMCGEKWDEDDVMSGS